MGCGTKTSSTSQAGANVVVFAWAADADLWAANENDIESIVSGIQFDTGS